MDNIYIKYDNAVIKGYVEDNVSIFRGIPYAKTLDFQKPEPYIIEGEYDATVKEIDGYQWGAFRESNSFYSKEFYTERYFEYAESPMTLNIVAPKDASNCSVLVFIHGGGYETGTVGELPYGVTKEYAKRNIVFVSIGYRLNLWSLFRNMNLGLHDQIEAIKWVYDHIEYFGGNKENITIMGQSAGAMSITNLLYCKKIEGIVKGAIMMSGGGMLPKLVGPASKKHNDKFWDEVIHKAGVNTDEEYQKLPRKQMWEAWYEVSRNPYNPKYVTPGIDGEIISDVPQKIFKRKEEVDVPIMLGVTSQDFMPIVMHHLAYQWAFDNQKKKKCKVYCYFFDKTPPGGDYKAFHACDLWYMFGNMDKCWRDFKEDDYKLASLMMDYVANFVNNHHPNDKVLPIWNPTTKQNATMRLFDGTSTLTIKRKDSRKKVWHTMLKNKGPM